MDAAARRLALGSLTVACSIGKGGFCPADQKREGDGCTPLGSWPIRGVLLRPGRMADLMDLHIPWRWIRPGDGWSDDPRDPQYNRPVQLPHSYSAETLARDDQAYDAIVVLGHNDAPPAPGQGSAIFFHLWVDARPTEGCVAIARDDMRAILPLLRPGMAMDIV